jgi:probable HAF family extracellular repeat protein
MARWYLAVLVAALLGLAAPSGVRGSAEAPLPRYTLTELGHLPGCDVTLAQGMNNKGQVVGYSYQFASPGHLNSVFAYAFLWQDGKMIPLRTLGGAYSHACGINDRGDIVGDADTRDSLRPVLWPAGKLDEPQVLAPRTGFALAINEKGEIAGVLNGLALWNGREAREFPPPEGRLVRVNRITQRGEVVGFTSVEGPFGTDWDQRAYRYRTGRMEELPTLGGKNSHCADINEAGLMVGWSSTAADERHACLWKERMVHDLSSLKGRASEAAGINAKGEIVGSTDKASGGWAACLWRNGKAVELQTLVEHGSDWDLCFAKRINDRGQILALGTRRDRGRCDRSLLLIPTR